MPAQMLRILRIGDADHVVRHSMLLPAERWLHNHTPCHCDDLVHVESAEMCAMICGGQPVGLLRLRGPDNLLFGHYDKGQLAMVRVGHAPTLIPLEWFSTGLTTTAHLPDGKPVFLSPCEGGFIAISPYPRVRTLTVRLPGLVNGIQPSGKCVVAIPHTPLVLLSCAGSDTIHVLRGSSNKSRYPAAAGTASARYGDVYQFVGRIELANLLELAVASPSVHTLEAYGRLGNDMAVSAMDVDASATRLAVAFGAIAIAVPLAPLLAIDAFAVPARASRPACHASNIPGAAPAVPSESEGRPASAAAAAAGDARRRRRSMPEPCVRIWACATDDARGAAAGKGFVPAVVLESRGMDEAYVPELRDKVPVVQDRIRFSPDGLRLVHIVCSGIAGVYDATTGRLQTIVRIPQVASDERLVDAHWIPLAQGGGLVLQVDGAVATTVEIRTPPRHPPCPSAPATAAASRSRRRGTLGKSGTAVGWIRSRELQGASSQRPNASIMARISRRGRWSFVMRDAATLPSQPLSLPTMFWAYRTMTLLQSLRKFDSIIGEKEPALLAAPFEGRTAEEKSFLLPLIACSAINLIRDSRDSWQSQPSELEGITGCTARRGHYEQQAAVCITCLLRAQAGAATARIAEAHGWLSVAASRTLLSMAAGIDAAACRPVRPKADRSAAVDDDGSDGHASAAAASCASKNAPARTTTSRCMTAEHDVQSLMPLRLPPGSVRPFVLCQHCADFCHAARGHTVRSLGLTRWFLCECASFRVKSMLEASAMHRVECDMYGSLCTTLERTSQLQAPVSTPPPADSSTKASSSTPSAVSQSVPAAAPMHSRPRRPLASEQRLDQLGIRRGSVARAVLRGETTWQAEQQAADRAIGVDFSCVSHSTRSLGLWCRCLKPEQGTMAQCCACRDWFHDSCLDDIGDPEVFPVHAPLPLRESTTLFDGNEDKSLVCAACVRIYVPGIVDGWHEDDLGHPSFDDALEQLLLEQSAGEAQGKRRRGSGTAAAQSAEPKRQAGSSLEPVPKSDDTPTESSLASSAAASDEEGLVTALAGLETSSVADKAAKLLGSIVCQASLAHVLELRKKSRTQELGDWMLLLRGGIMFDGEDEDANEWALEVEDLGIDSSSSAVVESGEMLCVPPAGESTQLVPVVTYAQQAKKADQGWRLCGLLDSRKPVVRIRVNCRRDQEPLPLAALPHPDSVEAMDAVLLKLQVPDQPDSG